MKSSIKLNLNTVPLINLSAVLEDIASEKEVSELPQSVSENLNVSESARDFVDIDVPCGLSRDEPDFDYLYGKIKNLASVVPGLADKIANLD